MKYFIKAMVILMTITIFVPAALAEQTQEERLEKLQKIRVILENKDLN